MKWVVASPSYAFAFRQDQRRLQISSARSDSSQNGVTLAILFNVLAIWRDLLVLS